MGYSRGRAQDSSQIDPSSKVGYPREGTGQTVRERLNDVCVCVCVCVCVTERERERERERPARPPTGLY